MSYEPTTWANGDIITATKLNNIESGVQSVSSSYTPTTWVNGDIITAVKLNNIEQGIANAGGGGSSDFSTAEVTITVTRTSADTTNILLPIADEEENETTVITRLNASVTAKVPLYSGKCRMPITAGTVTNVTGDAELDIDVENLTITGNCGFTMNVKQA